MPTSRPPRLSPAREHGDRKRRDRAVSSVVGIVLLVAIAVVLAGLLAAVATGFGDRLAEPSPTAAYEVEYHLDGDDNGGKAYFEIVHDAGQDASGDDVYVVGPEGNRVAWADVWTGGSSVQAGEYAHIDGYGSDSAVAKVCSRAAGDGYRLVSVSDGTSTVLATYELPDDPAPCP